MNIEGILFRNKSLREERMKRKKVRQKSFLGSICVCVAVVSMTVSAPIVSAQTLDSLQRAFVEKRFGMFIHFNMNTYHPGWGEARTNPLVFNPTNLDCAQWAAAAKSAGMKYGVLVCKHHDGFPIWQSKMTPLIQPPYTIAQSSKPTMDVVKSYTDAFRAAGLDPGLYMSMWDVAQGIPQTIAKWTPAQRTYILGQIRELLTNYGPIPIFMFDGYSWAMGHWAVPWQEIRDTIKALQPHCLIVETNAMTEPWETDMLFIEEPLNNAWCPAGNTYAAIQGQTIDGRYWFYRSGTTLLSVNDIVTTHLKALEPLYCNFQLNCPPTTSGQLDAATVAELAAIGKAWSPNTTRPPLPAQPPMIERPITPVSATATSGTAFNAIDDVNDWCRSAGGHFQTVWQSSGALPQSITLDLGQSYTYIDRLFYLPKRDSSNVSVSPSGYITSYKIYVSADGTTFTQISSATAIGGGTFGTWASNSKIKRVLFPTQTARYVRLEATAVSGGTTAVIGEVAVGGGPPSSTEVKSPAKNHAVQPLNKGGALAIGNFNFGPSYAGKTKSVAVYDLSGKLAGVKITVKNNIDLRKDFRVPNGAYIVKVLNGAKNTTTH
jgi:alpha-L-fucosidase